jgi:ABC-type molybdate transport system permease subunit
VYGLSGTGRSKSFVVADLIMALSLVLAGCGGGASGQQNGGGAVSGNIEIEGSSTVYPITQAAALSGIVAAVILGISRAIGETMIVTIAMGARSKACRR